MTAEEIRTPTAADIPALSQLYTEVFREIREPAEWLWKYFERSEYASMICTLNGRIVAHCGGVAVKVRDGSAGYGALQSTDFMSSPTYAGGLGGGGIFIRTVRAFYAEYCESGRFPMLYGFPGERHRLLGERLLGYRPVETVGELTMPGTEGEEVSLRGFEVLDESILRYLAGAEFGFGAVRDWEYLKWRYVDHPRHRYFAVTVRGILGRLKGVIVVRRSADEVLLFDARLPEKSRDLELLVGYVRAGGRKIRCWFSPGSREAQRLAAAGFSIGSRDHYFETRFFNGRSAPREGEFHYSLGDYDVF